MSLNALRSKLEKVNEKEKKQLKTTKKEETLWKRMKY